MIYNPVCEVCHGRPKMDRSVCCEDCWYSGRYTHWVEAEEILRNPQRALSDPDPHRRWTARRVLGLGDRVA